MLILGLFSLFFFLNVYCSENRLKINPLFTGTLLENKFLRTEDFSEKQFNWFQNMFSKIDFTYFHSEFNRL